MKNRSTSHLGFVALAFLLATAFTAIASIEDMTKAKVVRIKGSARYTAGTGTWQPLKVGDVLTSGTVIQTAADSRVDLVLGDPKAKVNDNSILVPFGSATPRGGAGAEGASDVDQNFVRMMENTVLSVDKLAATDTGADIVTDTQLDLRAGRILGTVKKLSAGSRYEVRIPNGVAGIRGTVFDIDIEGLLKVLEGLVIEMLTDDQGEVGRWEVNAGFKYVPAAGQIIPLTGEEGDELNLFMSNTLLIMQGSTPFDRPQPYDKDDPHISPTEGYDSQGENNNNQGGNNNQQ